MSSSTFLTENNNVKLHSRQAEMPQWIVVTKSSDYPGWETLNLKKKMKSALHRRQQHRIQHSFQPNKS